ncbi:MAG: MnmC family methyltransferase [Candidatus Hadarchaeum sp.]
MKQYYCAQITNGNFVNLRKKEILYAGWTGLQEVEIFVNPYFGKILVLDNDIQSAQLDECVYHETFVHSAMIFLEPKNVLIIGGGEGAMVREVSKYPGIQRIVMVDLDRELVNLCQEFLPEWSCGSFLDPRLEIKFEDVRVFSRQSDEVFDLIFMDCPSPASDDHPLAELYSLHLFDSLKKLLAPGGVFITQSHSLLKPVCDVYGKLREIYANVYRVCCYVPSFFDLWSFTIASDERVLPPFEDCRKRLQSIKMRFHNPHTVYSGFFSPYDWFLGVGSQRCGDFLE